MMNLIAFSLKPYWSILQILRSCKEKMLEIQTVEVLHEEVRVSSTSSIEDVCSAIVIVLKSSKIRVAEGIDIVRQHSRHAGKELASPGEALNILMQNIQDGEVKQGLVNWSKGRTLQYW